MTTPNPLDELTKALNPAMAQAVANPIKTAEILSSGLATSMTAVGGTQAVVPVVPPKPRAQPRLDHVNFSLLEQVMNNWGVMAQMGTTPDDVLKSDYWLNVAAKLRPGDTCHVRAEDMSWYMTVMVMQAEPKFATVEKLNLYEFATNADDNGPQGDLVVRWKGGASMHAIQRRSTGQYLKEGFRTRGDAVMWMAMHLKDIESRG